MSYTIRIVLYIIRSTIVYNNFHTKIKHEKLFIHYGKQKESEESQEQSSARLPKENKEAVSLTVVL